MYLNLRSLIGNMTTGLYSNLCKGDHIRCSWLRVRLRGTTCLSLMVTLHTIGLSLKYNMTTGLCLKRNITSHWTLFKERLYRRKISNPCLWYFSKSLQEPFKMLLIACEIERDYLPLLNGNIAHYWTLFKVQHDYCTLFKKKHNITLGSLQRKTTDTKYLTIIDVTICHGK